MRVLVDTLLDSDSLAEQTRRVLDNVTAILEAA